MIYVEDPSCCPNKISDNTIAPRQPRVFKLWEYQWAKYRGLVDVEPSIKEGKRIIRYRVIKGLNDKGYSNALTMFTIPPQNITYEKALNDLDLRKKQEWRADPARIYDCDIDNARVCSFESIYYFFYCIFPLSYIHADKMH